MNEKERADIIELLWCLKTAAGVCWEKLLEVDIHPEYRETAMDLLVLIARTCDVEAERLEKR